MESEKELQKKVDEYVDATNLLGQLEEVKDFLKESKQIAANELDPTPEALRALEVIYKEADRLTSAKKRAGQSSSKAEEFLNLVSLNPNVPKGYSKNAVTPYYREHHALKLKAILDIFASDRDHNRVLECKKFKMVKATLKQFVNQAWQYLIEKLDDGGVYANLRQQVNISSHNAGILLEWTYDEPNVDEDYKGATLERDYGLSEEVKEHLNSGIEFVNEETEGQTLPISIKFKEDLLAFIERGADRTKFERKKLKLNDEQVEYIRGLIKGVPGIIEMELSYIEVKLAKDLETWTQLNPSNDGTTV